MLPITKLPVMLGLLMWASFVVAQNTVGELLDAGARILTADEFKQEVVQRAIVGPSQARGMLEVIYTANGVVQGTASPPGTHTLVRDISIFGQWTIGEGERVCTSMRMFAQAGAGGSVSGVYGYFPPRCQFWFKLGDKYFLSDSDDDRSAKVLSRTIKQ
jgi:hypothetical protein